MSEIIWTDILYTLEQSQNFEFVITLFIYNEIFLKTYLIISVIFKIF